jgi:hypothetical protein
MRFVSELQRRNVIKVCVLYVLASWLLLQGAAWLVATISAPDWLNKGTLISLLLGFPVAVIFSWAYEITPEGLKLESDVEPEGSFPENTVVIHGS